jgi:hypothetical protein
MRRGRVAGRETWLGQTPFLAQAPLRRGCCHGPDRRLGADRPRGGRWRQAGHLLDQVVGTLASFIGDGGYDQERVYASVAMRHPEAAVIVPPRPTAVSSEMAETEPTQRDRHLQLIARFCQR